MLQEYKLQALDSLGNKILRMHLFNSESENHTKNQIVEHGVALPAVVSYSQCWSDYVASLSRVLCSFLIASENNRSQHVLVSAGRTSAPASSLYGELSVKWIMRVLLTVFPLLKACSNQNEYPVHLR